MSILKFAVPDLTSRLGDFAPVPAPLSDPSSSVRSLSVSAQPDERGPDVRGGVWECTPGRWRRQITQAEICYFQEGEAEFLADGSDEAVRISAGDAVYFPANTLGEWNILSLARKIYFIIDHKQGA